MTTRWVRRWTSAGAIALALITPRAFAACGDGIVNPTEQCDASAPSGDATCPGACIPPSTVGQCSCAVPDPDHRNFVIIAERTAKVAVDGAVASGGIAVTAPGGSMTLGKSVALPNFSSVVASLVRLSAESSVGRLHTNELRAAPGSIIGSGPFAFSPPPVFSPPLPIAPAGAPNDDAITVPLGGTLTLSPGSYGKIIIEPQGRLILAGFSSGSGAGTFHARSIRIGFEGRLEVENPVVLTIESKLALSSRAYLGPASGAPVRAGDIEVIVAGAAARAASAATVQAHVRVPNGKVKIGTGTTWTGQIVADTVAAGRRVDLRVQGGCGDGRLGGGEQCDASAPSGDVLCPGECIPGDPGGLGRVALGQPGQCSCSCDTNADCSDGDACNGVETCKQGRCVLGDAPSCDDGNPCTTDCTPAIGCHHVPKDDGTGCQDGNACTRLDTCQQGTCVGGEARDCSDGNPCTTDTCDTATGCVRTRVGDGTGCDDGNACTTGGVCAAGLCTPGTSVSCADGNPCTDDTCNPATGCAFAPAPNGVTCSDGNGCTLNDTCQLGACTGTTATNGTSCLDGSVCTQSDTCQSGVCVAGPPIDCNDSNGCTTDGCHPTTGCTHDPVANGTSCVDGNTCTGPDSCVAGACVGGPALPPGASCSDGNVCTDPDTCTAGTCIPGATTPCEDTNTCTVDTCDAVLGCLHQPLGNGTTCSDSNACTINDRCQAGLCVGGTTASCTDTNPCTADFCDSVLGCQNPPLPNGTSCGSGKTCTAGVCN